MAVGGRFFPAAAVVAECSFFAAAGGPPLRASSKEESQRKERVEHGNDEGGSVTGMGDSRREPLKPPSVVDNPLLLEKDPPT